MYKDPSATETGAAFLRGLYQKHGYLDAELVLRAATPVKSPIHNLFEWDEKKAARKWRLEQACVLIRSVRVTYEDRGIPVTVRAYVNTDAGYKTFADAMANPTWQDQVLAEAKRDAAAMAAKYRAYSSCKEIVRHLEEFSGK